MCENVKNGGNEDARGWENTEMKEMKEMKEMRHNNDVSVYT